MKNLLKSIQIMVLIIITVLAVGFVLVIIDIANGTLINKNQLEACQQAYTECANDKNYFKDTFDDFQSKIDACKLELGFMQSERDDYKEAFINVYPTIADYEPYQEGYD